jgi:hypothetical protein
MIRFKRSCVIATLAWICFAPYMKADGNTEKIFLDFAATKNAPVWEVVNDGVMGGLSRSSIGMTNGLLVFRGEVSLENNGGFASMRSAPDQQNLAGFDAFIVRARGDGKRYKLTVRTDTGFDTPLYQCGFTTKRDEWKEHRLPFKDFVPTFRGRVLTDVRPLNPAGVVSVGLLISDKQEGPFKLELAWIKACCWQ